MRKLSILFMIICLVTACANAQVKRQKKRQAPKTRNVAMNYRVLYQSTQCGMQNPFIFVARDAKTFSKMPMKSSENIKLPSNIDFSKEAVVAVFAGTKPTSGYDVEISSSGSVVSVKMKNPPKDAIVLEVLTSPCKIVAVQVPEDKTFRVEASPEWKMTEYKISQGKISYSGGFAPREKTYDVEGRIFAIESEGFLTLTLALNAKNDANIKIHETVSGTIENGKVFLERIDPNNFSEKPCPVMKASGTFSQEKIYLKLEPNPTVVVNDGFTAEGYLEATRKP